MSLTRRDAEAFFRIDSYVQGEARKTADRNHR